MRTLILVILAVGAGAFHAPARAQGADEWSFQVTPYAWMAGLDGTVATSPDLPPADVDMSFGDILDDLKFAGMLLATARKGPWVIHLDTTYVKTESTERLGGVVFDSATVKSETTTLAGAVGRTIAESPEGSVDAYVGARAWWLDNSLDIRAVGGGRTGGSSSASWVDPLIGVSGRYQPSDRWTLFGAMEVGGFGVGADIEWSAMAGAMHHFSDTFSATIGWRHMVVDYDEDGVVFDVTQTGPVLGATFRF